MRKKLFKGEREREREREKLQSLFKIDDIVAMCINLYNDA